MDGKSAFYMAGAICYLSAGAAFFIGRTERNNRKKSAALLKAAFLLLPAAVYVLLSGGGINYAEILMEESMILTALSDSEKHIIPNKYVFFTAIMGVSACFFPLGDRFSGESVKNKIIGAAGCMCVLTVLALVSKGGFGFGDVKILSCLTLLLGPLKCAAIFVFAVFASGLAALCLIAKNKLSRKEVSGKSTLPFAPFLALGYLVSLYGGA